MSKLLRNIFIHFFPKRQSKSVDDLKKIQSDKPYKSINDLLDVQCQGQMGVRVVESKGEKTCRNVLQNIFGHKFINTRPDFLKNPVTGRNLELDCFNEYLNIAVEYNGRQHYYYTPKFHENKQDFQCQEYRDYIKNHLCKENNTILIIIRYDIVDIEAFIIKNLEQQTVVINGIDYKLYFNGNQVFFIS